MCLAIPGQIVAITDENKRLALVDVAGVKRVINIACVVDPALPVSHCVGDWVLFHVGFAMARIDEMEARRTLQLLEELGDVQNELDALQTEQTTNNSLTELGDAPTASTVQPVRNRIHE